MTKEYLKMADAFVHDGVEALEQHIYAGYMSKHCCEYAAHAINSHDELVEQNENMKLRINQLLSERNATGVAIEKALNGALPEQHSMINRLQMIAGVAANRNELVAEVERLREHLKLCAIELSAMIDRYNVHNMEDDSWLYDQQTPWDAMQLLK